MKVKLITYKLQDPSIYTKITAQIKSYPNWAKVMDRVWLIKTEKTSGLIRDELRQAIDGKGEIFVIDVSGKGWGSFGIQKTVTTWMKENI